jgi:hypothetical protein
MLSIAMLSVIVLIAIILSVSIVMLRVAIFYCCAESFKVSTGFFVC